MDINAKNNFIIKTKDYCVFKDTLNRKISQWKSKNKTNGTLSHWELNKNYNSAFYLWGTAGSGKTSYLNIWLKDNKDFKKINKLSEIIQSGTYLFDGTNESNYFTEKKLQNLLSDMDIFIVFSGWVKSKVFSGHNINPSNDLVIEKGWNRFSKYTWAESFSIREKNLMCDIRNFDTLEKVQFHSLVWKGFENIMTNNERKYYKEKVSISPVRILRDNSPEFQSLLKKNIIQFNQKKYEYVYSHSNIVHYLFLRNHVKEIKCLKFDNMSIINIIRLEPRQFINWWISLGSKGDLINFLQKNKIKISVAEHKSFDPEINEESIEYSRLKFSDIEILINLNKHNRVYEEYLSENINTDRELNNDDLYGNDMSYFIYSIISPIKGDDYYPKIMNSMKITGFQNMINWRNNTNREKMLNFILGRYIQGYIDEQFSALKISELTETIFSNWDKENTIKFYDFVSKCWGSVEHDYSDKFDSVLNSGKGRSSILDASSGYANIDERFKTNRNNYGNDIFNRGHRSVNLKMYLLFEMESNNITYDEMNLFHVKEDYSMMIKGYLIPLKNLWFFFWRGMYTISITNQYN